MEKQLLAEETVALVAEWLSTARAIETPEDRAHTGPLHELIEDPEGVAFTMRFVDRVARPDGDRVAAHQLRTLVRRHPLPAFLTPIDRILLRIGGIVAPLLPGIAMPLARKRMRSLVGHLVVDAEPGALAGHLSERRASGFAQNVNLLGEAVLGEAEAQRRLDATVGLLATPDVDYVSVKLSAVASQLNYWDWTGSLDRVAARLRSIFRAAAASSPPTFVNLDMEEYHDLELTIEAFTAVLDEPEFDTLDAGIVLQAYLPDAYAALLRLVPWANLRHDRTGAEVKIRLVKGANLAMEKVEAAMHGWEQAPYATKHEVDASFKRCLDWTFDSGRMRGVRLGVASHNLFEVAWAHLLSEERGVSDRVDFEMLQGMAPAQSRVVRDAGGGMLLYTPIVAPTDFDVAIGYLFRRLEENAAEGNFMRVVFSLEPGSAVFEAEAEAFRRALADRLVVSTGPRRTQRRPAVAAAAAGSPVFRNEPDTDPALPSNRAWAADVVRRPAAAPHTPVTDSNIGVDAAVAAARASNWSQVDASDRRRILHAVADELARRRGDLINAMVHEGRKTIAQADPEVSEAIDFARYYGDRAEELDRVDHVRFEPLGVVAVIPPWNFPVAIPAGGVLASLAAGNAVVFKPSSQTPRCAEIVAECAWAAGVPREALQFLRTRGRDVGRHLVTTVDGVILTGSVETARMFQDWKPDLRLFAETSGKNAMIITPHADIDLAVADLVDSAFGHSGQKCSAASLAICVGDVYESERFRRQLVDAVQSLVIGQPWELSTTVGPTISSVEGKLERALTTLESGEQWLVAPERLGDEGSLWRPGVRIGVASGSWFHQTECFGPVLGIMHAPTLAAAIAMQNANPFGLTGGIHTLDPEEVETWLDRVEVGNAYVNRVITGAIVQRQPFGGWKRSNIGPGAKAGGPNYVMQLGTWRPDPAVDLRRAAPESDRAWWDAHFSVGHDPTGLFCEENTFRYRPLERIAVRASLDADPGAVDRVMNAARRCGVPVIRSDAVSEPDEAFAARLPGLGVERVRMIGTVPEVIRRAAVESEVHLADGPVTASGRIELQHYLREQALSRTLHRFGNLVAVDT